VALLHKCDWFQPADRLRYANGIAFREVVLMKFWAWSALSLLGLGVALSAASANGLRPPPAFPHFNQGFALRTGANDVKLVVVVDPMVKQPRLEVPRSLLITGTPPRGPFGDAGGPSNVMAGLALALAFTSGGLWLSKRGRSVAITLAAVSLLTFAGAVGADIPRPKPPKAPPPVSLPANVKLSGKLTMQIVPAGDAVRLVVSPSMLDNSPKVKIAPKSRAE
jgi:hypothetical protein